jgi:hypothetical protein
MAPLEYFTHEFIESQKLDEELAAKADVILAHLDNMDVRESVHMLASCRGRETEIILIASKEQTMLLTEEDLSVVKDIWTMPMSVPVFKMAAGL